VITMPASTRWKLLSVLVLLVVALGGVGSYVTLYRQAEPRASITATATSASAIQTLTVTTTRFKLSGKIFFDYNGNGKQEAGEPDLSDVAIALDGKNVTATNSTGWYATNAEEGIHKVGVFPPKKFRYMCESDAEFRSVKDSYTILVANDTRKDIALMEGFLTLPFAKGTPEYNKRFYVNISNTSRLLDWRGGTDTYQRGDYKHSGTDFAVRDWTQIVAAAPGTVFALSFNDPNGGHTVWIKHSDGYYTYYAHLNEVKVEQGQIVRRGELLGLSGSSTIGGNIVPHVHLEVRKPPYPGGQLGGLPGIDPYRSLVPPLGSPLSLWTKDNDPQFFM